MHAYLISQKDMPTSSLNSRTYSSTPLRVCCTMEQYTLATPGCRGSHLITRISIMYLFTPPDLLISLTYAYAARWKASIHAGISREALFFPAVRGGTCSGHKQ